MPKHFTEEEKKRICQELLSTGLELFEKYGISKTNVNDITEQVGISKGSFYAFFASKGDLFMEIYRLERERAHAEVFAEVTDDEHDFGYLIKKYTEKMYIRMKESRILSIIYDFEGLKMISDKSVKERLFLFNERTTQQLADMIQFWMERDGPYEIDAIIATKMLRSINFLRFHDYVFGMEDFEKMVGMLTEAVIDYIKDTRIK